MPVRITATDMRRLKAAASTGNLTAERARGWRVSPAVIDEVMAALADGSLPATPSRYGGWRVRPASFGHWARRRPEAAQPQDSA